MNAAGGVGDPPTDTGITFTRRIHHDTYPFINPVRRNDTQAKHVFIASASSGMGKAMAISYAKAGASMICICARSELSSVKFEVEAAARHAGRATPKVVALRIDLQDERSLAGAARVLFQEFEGRLDVLVNNAGVGRPAAAEAAVEDAEIHGADWRTSWEINAGVPFLVTKAFLPLLLSSEDSAKTIVNVNSIAAQMLLPGVNAYRAARFALLHLTEYLDVEHRNKGLVVYCMHPGAVRTELGSNIPEELLNKLIDTPELMGDTITFLTGEKREWLGGRYISCTWDMEEFLAKKEEIIGTERLKMRMSS